MRPLLAVPLLVLASCPSCSTGPSDAGPSCQRLTCQSGMCGEQQDDCNGILQCGACEAGLVCGGGGMPNVCGAGSCSPQTCFELGKNCNLVSDGCSKLIDCGRCLRPADCGIDGRANVCGGPSCIPRQCPPGRCGTLGSNDCGSTLVCNVCNAPQTCGGGGMPGVCGCIAKTCADFSAACGRRDDTCGTALSCGACSTGRCSVGGAPNICGECAQTDGRVCSAGCWCWDSPRPTGNAYSAIWGTGPNDVWLFGYGSSYLHATDAGFVGWPGPEVTVIESAWGSAPDDIWAVSSSDVVANPLLHWDGITWWPVPLSFNASLRGVWGFAANDVWAVGETDILHYDGTRWTLSSSAGGLLQDVWGAAPNDVWAVGNGIFRFDGQTWSTQFAGTFFCVRGTARDDVWAGTASGLWRFDGTSWLAVPAAGGGKFSRLLAFARNDVYVARDERLVHFDGTAWSEVYLPAESGALDGLWGTGPDDVWVSVSAELFHKDARGWHVQSALAERSLVSVHAVSPTEQWAVGGDRILRGDGTRWSFELSGSSEGIQGVSAAGGRVWAVGTSIFASVDGGAFRRVTRPASPITLAVVHAVSANEAYAAGSSPTVLAWDGGAWGALPAAPAGVFQALWASSPQDLWVGGALDGELYRWNGTQWRSYDAGVPGAHVAGLWGAGGEVFAARTFPNLDAGAGLLRFDGGTWSQLPGEPPGVRWSSVWARSPSEVWFAGSGGHLAFWDGSVLRVQQSSARDSFTSVTGAAGRIWAVGSSGVVRVDGPGVEPVYERIEHVAFNDTLVAISGSAPDDVWAVGTSGTPHHWNGTTWVTHQLAPEPLTAVWARAPTDVWVGTGQGLAWHWDGGTWSSHAATPVQQIRDLWGGARDDVWAVAQGGLAHWNGTAWTRDTSFGTADVWAVHGTAANDVWVSGSSMLHFTGGSSWTVVRRPTTTMTTLWCTAPDDCWAAGHKRLEHWNGTAWVESASPFDGGARDVWGRDRNDVWLFSTDGRSAHWNGFGWREVPLGAGKIAFAAWGSDAGVWAVSGSAVLFHGRQ